MNRHTRVRGEGEPVGLVMGLADAAGQEQRRARVDGSRGYVAGGTLLRATTLGRRRPR